MGKNSDGSKILERFRFRFISISIICFIIWFFTPAWIPRFAALYKLSDTETGDSGAFGAFGAFGDQFGAINALFAGIALVGIIAALVLQQKQLKIQQKDLEITQDEIKKQNFEISFFQRLNFHNEIVKSLVIRQGEREYLGRQCFYFLLISIENRYKYEKGKNEESKYLKELYEAAYAEFQSDMCHYFRYLHIAIKFVDEHEFFEEDNKEKKKYTDLIHAQLSSNELRLIFYHCLREEETCFKCLVEKYGLFKDLDFETFFLLPKVRNIEARKKLYCMYKGFYDKRAYGEDAATCKSSP